MKKITFLTTLSLIGLSFISSAQQDSSRLDAGVLVLNRELTQNITIKGTDLEKMPFTDLSTALGAWLYGAYSTAGTLTYVVDGNIVSDVDMYSIYDIDEVVLVQNAATLSTFEQP